MSKTRARTTVSLSVLILASLAANVLGHSLQKTRSDWPVEESYVTLPPPKQARFVSLGYNEMSADITWSRLLVYYGSGFVGEGDFRYLGNFLRTVIALDPQFKKVYEWASYAITVSENHQASTKAQDIKQSIDILEKAMIEFPDDYEFFWLAGIRYFLDLKSDDTDEQRRFKEHGASLMEEAMRKPGAPTNLANKAAGFRSLLGQNERARANLMEMIMTTDDVKAKASMLGSFKSIAGEALTKELTHAVKQLAESRLQGSQQIPEDLFVILSGPEPSPLIDFDKLATERDLIGSKLYDDDSLELFP